MTTTKELKPKRVGYARVSTDHQTTYQYEDLLTEAGCDLIFLDEAVSAAAANRPELIKARESLMPGDTFIVPAIDRAFRSTIEGIMFLDGLHAEGISFQSIYQQIDTRTPEGRKWFIDMVNNAEYERAVISRRTKEKMAAAKRKGIHCGRPLKLTEAKVRKAHIQIAERGLTVAAVAKKLRVSTPTLRRGFVRWGIAQ